MSIMTYNNVLILLFFLIFIVPEKNVQQRWKTARDAYMRCKNVLKNTPSGSGGSKKKVFIYFEDMKFLDKKTPS